MRVSTQLFSTECLRTALPNAFAKLDPRALVRQPVLLVTALAALVCTWEAGRELLAGQPAAFHLHLAVWLWFTVLFANFAESLAESRGRAQARALRAARGQTIARRLQDHSEHRVPAAELQRGDCVVCEAGDVVPADGEVIEGIASVDESAVTGESAPVVRESGGDRSAVTGGTRVLSDRIVIRIASEPGGSFLDRMIALVEGADRQPTPNERALNLLLVSLTLLFGVAVGTLPFFVRYSETASHLPPNGAGIDLPVLAALLVCLIPTTIGGLLSAIGISGLNRLVRKNVLATSGRAVEAAGDVDVLLLDKTGTITLGNRQAVEFHPAPGVPLETLADAAQLASLADETPEGRSITVLAKRQFGLRGREIAAAHAVFLPFTAQTRMSGVDIPAPANHVRRIRKGSAEAVRRWIEEQSGAFPREVDGDLDRISRAGGTPLVVAEGRRVLGTVHLKDVVKGGIRERFAQLRRLGIRTVMITGDNPLTAAAIAAEAGVDDFMAGARPEDKLARIRTEQAAGHRVAMTGDGTNDAPALAQADVGVAMNTGTQAAREAGNMVDLDSNPTKLIEIVEIGKELLMTRGALTTFSVANDVAKYFAILPALFAGLYATGSAPGPLAALNVMNLTTPQSAILSALIFNALIIVALIPLALRGVTCSAGNAAAILRRNLLVYGFGGLIAPFLGIKGIDMALAVLQLA